MPNAGKIVTIQTEMPGDIDGILDTIRRIILLGGVQRIVLDKEEPISYQRYIDSDEEVQPSESTSSFAELTLLDIIRNIPMEEFECESSDSPYERVFRMFFQLAEDNWVVTHLLLGGSTKFWKWLNIGTAQKKRLVQFLGAHIETDKTLPDNVFILCGSRSRNASISEVCLTLKGNIE